MFNPSAPLPPLTAEPGLYRSNSSLRKNLQRLVSPHAKVNKPTCLDGKSPDPTAPSNPTRSSFLKSSKMRSFHRKQRSGDSVTSVVSDNAPPIETTSPPVKELEGSSVHVHDRRESVVEVPSVLTLSDIYENGDASIEEEESEQEDTAFVGLPDYRVESADCQSLIDPGFLEKAFGITMERPANAPKLANLDIRREEDRIIQSRANDDDFSTDQAMQPGKDRRPRIQVSIPEKKTRTSPSARNHDSVNNKAVGTPYTVSPPSTTTLHHKPFTGVATARLSIISPISVMEMPKPRRPFSAVSLEGMTADIPPNAPAGPNSRSTSSDDASERDGKSSSYSPRSSMSSVVSDSASYKQQGNGRLGPPQSTRDVGREGASPSKPLRKMTSAKSLQGTTPPRSLKTKRSNASMSTPMNKNKPLPPEPGQVSVAPLNLSPSRSSSLTVRPRATPAPLTASSTSLANSSNWRSSKASTLRSKYTPKDLDALDDAFQRNMPLKDQKPMSYSSNSSPTLSQVTLALESHLDTIKEDSPHHSLVIPFINDPLQISRGPMRMEPSRKAPVPPGRNGTSTSTNEIRKVQPASVRSGSPIVEPRRVPMTAGRTVTPVFESQKLMSSASSGVFSQTYEAYENNSSKRREVKRSASSNHVATQIKGPEISHKRASTVMVTSNSKANRVLGKSGSISPVLIERNESMESPYMSNESPQVYTSCTSPTMSGGSHTPESELSSAPDAHFEEIRKRLELLSPKDDPSITFLAFHEKNASRASMKSSLLRDNDYKLTEPFHYAPLQYEVPIPQFIAELEANRTPSPVELEDTQRSLPAPLIVESKSKGPSADVSEVPISPTESNIHPLRRSGQVDASPHPPPIPATKARSVHSARSVKARSLASLAMSEIPELYAELPGDPKSTRPSMTAEEVEHLISADAAERVLLRILQKLDNLSDLFAAAKVSRGFYRTFKRHELPLLKNALFSMSPAAWELREMSIPFTEIEDGSSDYSPSLYLRHYTTDLFIMVELKSMMLEHCKSFLHADTIKRLAGETDRSSEIDDAFWRVWTFCRIFGCGKGREDDIVGQMDWLRGGKLAKQQSTDTNTLALNDGVSMNSVLFNPPRGFAKGNMGGLTAEELYDMTEIWTCLGVLVRGYQGRREEAREYGIFDKTNIASGDVEKENSMLGAYLR